MGLNGLPYTVCQYYFGDRNSYNQIEPVSGQKAAQWPSGRASDSGARGRGFETHSGPRVVSLSKIHLPPKSTGNTQEAVAPSRND